MHTINKMYYKALKGKFPERDNFITFRYMIPFRLPFHSDLYVELDGVLFTFLHRQYNHYAKNDFNFDTNKIKNTIVEATIPLTKSKRKNIFEEMRKKPNVSDKDTSEEFDKQFNILNDFCQTLLVMYGLYNIKYLSLHNIVGIPEYTLYEIKQEEVEINSIGDFKAQNRNYLSDIVSKKLTATEVNTTINNYYSFKEHPYYMFIIYGRRGEKAFFEEDFNQSIIYFQTAMEILTQKFIVDCYTKMNWKPIHTINNLSRKKEFTKHVEHFLKILEKLKLPNQILLTKLVKNYKDSCFKYRNNIVHEGTHYGREEARKTKVLVSDITNLLLHDIRKAPKNKFTDYYNSLYDSTSVDVLDIQKRRNTRIK